MSWVREQDYNPHIDSRREAHGISRIAFVEEIGLAAHKVEEGLEQSLDSTNLTAHGKEQLVKASCHSNSLQ